MVSHAVARTLPRDLVRIGPLGLPGHLELPDDPAGLVVFAHGSGSSRNSPRNRQLAGVLQCHHLGTLLFDLLAAAEAGDRCKVFDIALLGTRIGQVLAWVALRPDLAQLPVGLFGASTGAAAALLAASEWPGRIGAIVSRGGRPDLALHCLDRVQAPTMLLVGAADGEVVQCNRIALRALRCKKRLELIPGATDLFPEPGALESVAELAASWFATHLVHPHLQ